ncbi:hypothetical protein BJY52DRAFT_488398 [Lactarius psammicola]|nr:hypothetical protein BJY52DRAFT_488398 [Lactarius psammicola]
MLCTEQCDQRERLPLTLILRRYCWLIPVISYLGISYSQLAQRVNSSEQRVVDICTGKAQPTTKEFNDLATTLGISNPPRDAAHATR